MTYDELLEAVNSPTYMQSRTLDHPYIALRAVVELHSPQDITLPNGDWGSNCIECDGLFYPCPTILAIKKELQ
jgi:hypothetical protein